MAKQLITTIAVPTPYDFAVANGFVGTEEEWLASLKGATGDITPAALAAKTAAESARDTALTAKDEAVAAAAAVPGLQEDLEALEESLPGTYGTVLVYSSGAYPARPPSAASVKFIGPVQPTSWLPNDEWVDNS